MVLSDPASLDALLPVEIWDEVVPFLTGWELFNLMAVNREAHALLSAAKWWTRRLDRTQSADELLTANSQATYTEDYSFAFMLDDKKGSSSKNGPVALTAAFSIPFLFGRDSRTFSLEVWFALPGSSHGGIILGAGTPFHISPSWNPMFETWISVDQDRNIFTSVLAASVEGRNLPVALGLERDRWHHLVITFETRAAVVGHIAGADRDHWRVGEERVYLNGEVATVRRGSLSRFWNFNSFVLLGTGCNSNAASQSGEGKQWYPFKGVVDDMKIWHSLLLPDEVKALATHDPKCQSIRGHIHSWKELATGAGPKRLRNKSIEFRGSHDSRPLSRGVSVTVVNRSNFQRGLMEDRLEFHPFCPDGSSSFAIEVWFYLLPENARNWGGGIILGAQSRDVEDSYSPAHTRQLIYVDRHGRLYASVLDEIMYPSAQRLLPRRWYHVVLRYHDGRQEVFLNGKSKRSSHGALLRDWKSLSHMQVGTGCVNNTRGSPKGWYGFHGRMREVRIWGPRLKDRQFATILSSSTATSIGSVRHLEPVYSLQRDGRLPHVVCVQNSRPRERVFAARIDAPRGATKPQRSDSLDEPPPPPPAVVGSPERAMSPSLQRSSPSSRWLKSIWRRATLASH